MSSESSAQELMESTRAATRAARRARQAYWFPLLVFGCIAAGATPFYVTPSVPFEVISGNGSETTLFFYDVFLPGQGTAADLYWLFALIAGYAAVLLFYRLRARRAGVAGRVWPALAVGAGALVLLLLTGSWVPAAVSPDRVLPLDFFVRGLVPLVVIGIGVLALAWSERSAGLLAFGLCFLAVTAVANLYDLENLVHRMGWDLSYRYDFLPDLLLPAAVLLLGGVGFLLRARLRR